MSPALGGFSMAFYQDKWVLIKEDLVKVFQELFERIILNSSMFERFVYLIPKKENVIEVKDFRPISLIVSVFKIFAKVFANLVKGMLSSTISDMQGAFVVGDRSWINASLLKKGFRIIDLGSRKECVLRLILEKLMIMWIGISWIRS